MRVSELIAALQEVLEVDGDWPVYGRTLDDRPFEIDEVEIDHTELRVVLE